MCHDRMLALADANEFERAASLARVAKKKFQMIQGLKKVYANMNLQAYVLFHY